MRRASLLVRFAVLAAALVPAGALGAAYDVLGRLVAAHDLGPTPSTYTASRTLSGHVHETLMVAPTTWSSEKVRKPNPCSRPDEVHPTVHRSRAAPDPPRADLGTGRRGGGAENTGPDIVGLVDEGDKSRRVQLRAGDECT